MNVPALAASITLLLPALTEAQPHADPTVGQNQLRPRDDKRPGVALVLSLGPTLAGAGLLIAAGVLGQDTGGDSTSIGLGVTGGILMLVGPTLGHTYSGRTWNTGLAIRLGGVAALVGGAALITRTSGSESVGVAVFAGGSLLALVGTVWEIGKAPAAAAQHNARNARLTITSITTRRDTIPALAIFGRF